MNLDADSVCRIIEVCGKQGVSVLKFGPLEISYGATPVVAPVPEIANSVETARLIHTDTISRQEIETKDELLGRLQIEDPVELEKLYLAGDVDDRIEEN